MSSYPDASDRIEVSGSHRGVALHSNQSARRLEVVKADIDAAFALDKVRDLLAFADDTLRAPESRLLAGALLRASHDLAEENRGTRPAIDFEWLAAALAGLDSRRWQSNVEYTTLLDPRPGVERDEPLDEE